MTDAIKVAVRVRPLSKQERESGHTFAWNVQSNSISPVDVRDTRYALDHVFGPNWTTRRIYEATTQPLLHKVISGFNSTVFAYGQTSSGKTYTMRGTPEDAGLIPLAIHEIFALIESCQDREFLLRVSYMELYNEEVHDLLAPKQMKLPIHESKENGVYVCGLREDIVTSPEQVLALLQEGETNRHVGSTKMNDTSSRSHTLFRMVVESRELEADMNDAGAVLVSTLTLVDLAGSERVAKTGAEGIRMKEGTAINKSLLTLGNVINKLSEGAQAQGAHIPYRDSKLTRILQPSLGGNAKTSVICAITPAVCHTEESHSTLRFACRAKRVVNNAVVNEVLSDAAVLKRQAHEIEELKDRLSATGMTAEVEEQISHLRAQHLRSEQEKDLYRIKLEEEKMEREKAQKQVEVARKMMFEGGPSRDDAPKKNSRRETWCPGGKAGWQAPAGAAEAFQGSLQGDTGIIISSSSSGGARKRSYNQGDRTTAAVDGSTPQAPHRHRSTGAIVEGEETDDNDGEAVETVGEGPTPQRRRRAGKSMGSTSSDASDLRDGDALLGEMERIADSLDGQDLVVMEAAISQWGVLQASVAAMQRELDDVSKLATTKDNELRFAESEMEAAVEERDRLAPQVEEAKWHARKLEKRLEEAQAAHQATRKDRDSLAEQLSSLQESSAAEAQELAAKVVGMEEERAALKEQVKALNASLADAKDALEYETEQRKLVEARVQNSGGELAEIEAQLSKRSAEMDALRKAQAIAEERMEVAEGRSRDLYEANKRLESHVHDLESRKRAPLYQKKQEEELRAANEKATEADVRAAEAEMNAREFKATVDNLEVQVADLHSAAERAARAAAEAASEAAAKHGFEVQRLSNERAKLQESHVEELQQINSLLEATKEELAGQHAVVAAQSQQVEELQAQIAELQRQMAERLVLEEELQACANAASEKITHLEDAAEATQAAHDATVEGLSKELQEAKEAASAMEASLMQQLQAEAETAAEQLRATQEQTSVQVKAAQEQAEAAQAVASTATANASKQLQEMKAQVTTMEARLSEAAGALKAKDELKEERMKHKQEVSSLKSDLQKLQLETKNGGKSKEMAAKEAEALKKKILDLETKLKVAVQDKTSAVQERSKLEAQVKQLVSQKQLHEKSHGKQQNIEEKKRESIMVNFNKNREVLSCTEEKLKTATVELQKMHMDLTAKRSECQNLEGQVTEHESKVKQLQADNGRLSTELTTCQQAKDALQAEHTDALGRLTTTSSELSALQAAHAETTASLSQLQEQHTAVTAAKDELSTEVEQLRASLQELSASSTEMAEQTSTLQAQHAELTRQHGVAQEELAAARAAASSAEDARIAAESRLPELQELQQQLSAAHEEVADLQYAANEQQAVATQQAAAAAAQVEAADKVAKETQAKLSAVEASLEAMQGHRDELQQQLDQAVELYNVVQGHANTLTEDKARLEQQLTEKAAEQEGLAASTAALEGDVGSLRAELESMRAQLSQAESAAAASAASLAQSQADLEAARAGKEAAQQEAVASKAEVDAAAASSEEAASLQSQLTQAMQEFTDLEFSWNEERAALEAQATQLREELAAAHSAVAAAKDKDSSEGSADVLAGLQVQLEGYMAQVASLQQQLQGAEDAGARVASLEQELEVLRGKHKALSEERAGLQQQLSNQQAAAPLSPVAAKEGSPAAFGSPVAAAVPAEETAGALAALEQHNAQLASQRDQLLGIIDDLSVQLASSKAQTERGAEDSQTSSDNIPAVAELQQALARSGEELASKEAQLQEVCQAYNTLTDEVADKDLQFQQLRAAGTSEDEAAAHQRQELEQRLAEADAGLASLRARCAQLEAELHDSKQLAAPAAAVATEEGPQSMEVDACTAPEAHAQAEGVVSEGAAAAGQAELEAQVAQLKDALNAALAARDTVENHLQLSLDDAAAARAAMKAAQQQLSDQNDQTSGMLTQQLMQQISMPAQQQQLEEGSDVAQQRDQKQANEEGNADGAQQDSMPQQQELVHQVAQLQIALHNAVAARASVEARLLAETQEAQAAASGLGSDLDAARARVEALEANLSDSEALAEQLRAAVEAKTAAAQKAASDLEEAQSSASALAEQTAAMHAGLEAAQEQAAAYSVEMERLKEAYEVEAGRRKEAQAAGEALQSSLDDLNSQMSLLEGRAQHAEQEAASLAEALQASQLQQQGPTPAQQEMLARMAQRLEALEAGHRRAVERLHEERDEAHAAVETLQAQVEEERQHGVVAVEEVDLCAKAKEAELNARMLSLESQIHWLGEQNTQLQAELAKAGSAGGKENSSASAAEAEKLAELSQKYAALEADLRKTKRAELKLQALLFRMRSDIEKAGGSTASFDNLRDVRGLEYDVDMLTQKLKRTERLLQQQQQQARTGGTPQKAGVERGGGLKASGPLADKENMGPQQANSRVTRQASAQGRTFG